MHLPQERLKQTDKVKSNELSSHAVCQAAGLPNSLHRELATIHRIV